MPRSHTSVAGLALVLGCLAPASAWAAPPDQVTPRASTIVGGTASATCAWPTVVALQAGGLCTGTLVHPRVVVYAAHCGTFHTQVFFGERIDAPTRTVATVQCERATDVFGVSSMDFAYCLLAEPVEDIAITPMLVGCNTALLTVGTPVTIVGFGDTTTSDPQMVGVKYEAASEVVSVLTMVGIGGMGVGADAGDSGGPAFVQLDDGSWHVLGIVSGGGGDGKVVQYVPAALTVEWIEDRSGVDITPCHDRDGDWQPTPACEGFYVQTQPGATWPMGCPSERSGPADQCGPAWTELSDDEPPSVAFIDPLDGDTLPGAPVQFDVNAEADDGDGVGVASVRLHIDGLAAPQIDEVPPYRFDAVTLTSDGAHLLELEATDAFGNVGWASATIIVGQVDDTDGETGGSPPDTETEAAIDEGQDAGGPGCACASTSEPEPSTLPMLLSALMLLMWVRPRGARVVGVSKW